MNIFFQNDNGEFAPIGRCSSLTVEKSEDEDEQDGLYKAPDMNGFSLSFEIVPIKDLPLRKVFDERKCDMIIENNGAPIHIRGCSISFEKNRRFHCPRKMKKRLKKKYGSLWWQSVRSGTFTITGTNK